MPRRKRGPHAKKKRHFQSVFQSILQIKSSLWTDNFIGVLRLRRGVKYTSVKFFWESKEWWNAAFFNCFLAFFLAGYAKAVVNTDPDPLLLTHIKKKMGSWTSFTTPACAVVMLHFIGALTIVCSGIAS